MTEAKTKLKAIKKLPTKQETACWVACTDELRSAPNGMVFGMFSRGTGNEINLYFSFAIRMCLAQIGDITPNRFRTEIVSRVLCGYTFPNTAVAVPSKGNVYSAVFRI